MPELPEVETIRRQLAPRITGRTIVAAEAHASPKFATATDAVTHRVESVGRRGKYLITRLDCDRELIVHLGMTGSLRIADPDAPPDPYLRASWTLDDGSALEFSDIRRFGRIAVLPAGEYQALPTLHALGPEPLSDDFEPGAFHAALRASTRPVKTQLMSQRPVAGVGNIYADEALWRAGVHPASRRTTRPQSERIHDAVRNVLSEAIARNGTTLRDYRTFEGGTGDNQNHLECYGRAGRPCLRCGTELRRSVIDARGHDLVPELPAPPMNEPATDRARLVGAAYADPGPLAARSALYRYQDEPLPLVDWVLDHVEREQPLGGDGRVLDVGCGPGSYLAALRTRHPGINTIGFDLSGGMARAARDSGSVTAVADAMQIPARTAPFDLVICAHMLYHVPDIALAASELARVAGADGLVAVVTNGARHLRELDALTSEAFVAVTGAGCDAPARSAARFLLDDAPDLLAPALDVVRTERASRAIIVPDPAPLVAYVESERSLFEPALPVAQSWGAVLAAVDRLANNAIGRDGAFVVHSDVGVLLCRSTRR